MAEPTKKPKPKRSARKPASTPQERENLMINLAEKQAERQLKEGTASSQVILHYLKLGSEREALEREKLRNENQLIAAKKQALDDSKERAKMYESAIEAMARYSGEKKIED